MKVELFKRHGSYIDKNGEERTIVNLFIGVDEHDLIPIDAVYYRNKDGNPDTNYSSRKRTLTMLASELPPVAKKASTRPLPAANLPGDAAQVEDVPDFE